jgi:hypothetical protein
MLSLTVEIASNVHCDAQETWSNDRTRGALSHLTQLQKDERGTEAEQKEEG